MLARTSTLVLSLLLASSGLAVGCAAPAADDGAEGQTSNVTGGTGSVDSPVVFLFDTPARTSMKCVGAMLSNTIAVTAKACAKKDLVAGRATDKDGKGKSAKVKAVILPDSADADIALVELDKPLEGTNAVITHMPLRDGYSVNGAAAVDGKGLLDPDKGEGSTVKGAMFEESATHGSILPTKGSEICGADIGAPVCSTSSFKIAGFNVAGTCGLSGLVVGPVEAAAAAPSAPAASGAASGEQAPAASACSGKAWKVAQLGQYAEFLKKHAPKAFEPLRINKPILDKIPYAPEGLWGYKTKGDVKACKIETATLAAAKPGESSAKVSAKVSFANMDKKAAAFGRFGIAPKSDPTKMRWLPAKAIGSTSGVAFEAAFEGVVSADKAGDYVVSFRASANGGETWTQCDRDGIDNGFSVEKALALQISDTGGTGTGTGTGDAGDPYEPHDPDPYDPGGGERDDWLERLKELIDRLYGSLGIPNVPGADTRSPEDPTLPSPDAGAYDAGAIPSSDETTPAGGSRTGSSSEPGTSSSGSSSSSSGSSGSSSDDEDAGADEAAPEPTGGCATASRARGPLGGGGAGAAIALGLAGVALIRRRPREER